MKTYANLLINIFLILLVCFACKPEPQFPGIDVTVSDAKKMIQNKSDLVILDLRTPDEINDGTIKGAIEIDFKGHDFKKQITQLDPDKEYLLYCASGGRSKKAWNMMQKLGIKKVYNMLGGYNAWIEVN